GAPWCRIRGGCARVGTVRATPPRRPAPFAPPAPHARTAWAPAPARSGPTAGDLGGRGTGGWPMSRAPLPPGQRSSRVEPPPAPPIPADPARQPEPDLQRMARLWDDQRARWRGGERKLVEAYLEQQPTLRADADRLLYLIYNEVLLREERGEAPQL